MYRQFLVLASIFLIAFLSVTAWRMWSQGWRFGGGWMDDDRQFRPENYSLSHRAPLELGDVELLARLNDEYAMLTRAVVPSVVSINTESFHTARMLDFWGRPRLKQFSSTGQGSGVIVTQEGHVLTNYHVIAGQQKISVTLHGGKVMRAKVIGEDKFLDVAVLKIEGDGPFEPLKFGDSSEVEVGQLVFAVGNPFGLGETVTQGIISAKERSLSDSQRDLFQTDAAINPGNSGGPLVNLRGEIIGINVAIFSPDRENPGFQGVGFSIPSNDARDTLIQILERGRPVRGFLGVQMRDMDLAVRQALNYQGDHGSVVIGVSPGSPADMAGLKPGDVVLTYQGEKIQTYGQLFNMVQSTKVGQTVNFDVWRRGKVLTLEAVIAESESTAVMPDEQVEMDDQKSARELERVLRALGIEVRELSVPERMRGFRGVVVTSLSSEGLAAKILQPGDLITSVNGEPVAGAVEFFMKLGASAGKNETRLIIRRSGEALGVTLPVVK